MSNEIPWLNSAELVEERDEAPAAPDSLIPVEIEGSDDTVASAASRDRVPKRSYGVAGVVLAATSAAFALGAAYARRGEEFDTPRPRGALGASVSQPVATPAEQPQVSAHVEAAQRVPAEQPAPQAAAPVATERRTLPSGDTLRAAFASLNRGDPQGAVTRAKAVLKRSPHRADAWLVLGSAYDVLHDTGSAQAAFRECLERGRGPAVKTCMLLAH